TREEPVEVHRQRLGVDGHHADGPLHADEVGHRAHGGGVAGDLEHDVGAVAAGPLVDERGQVATGPDHVDAELGQHVHPELVDLADDDTGAALARHHGDQRADGPAAEDHHL